MDNRKMSFKELKESIIEVSKRKIIADDAIVVWAEVARPNDPDCLKGELIPGTVMFGTETRRDGHIVRETLYMEPERISRLLN